MFLDMVCMLFVIRVFVLVRFILFWVVDGIVMLMGIFYMLLFLMKCVFG